MKKNHLIFPFLSLIALLASCVASDPAVASIDSSEPSPTWGEPSFDERVDIIETISITSLSWSETSEEINVTETEILNLSDPNLIHDLITMLNNWPQEHNVADSAIDGPPNYNIHFDDKATISYVYPGKDLGYICLIQNKYFYLPKVFGEKIDLLILSNLSDSEE